MTEDEIIEYSSPAPRQFSGIRAAALGLFMGALTLLPTFSSAQTRPGKAPKKAAPTAVAPAAQEEKGEEGGFILAGWRNLMSNFTKTHEDPIVARAARQTENLARKVKNDSLGVIAGSAYRATAGAVNEVTAGVKGFFASLPTVTPLSAYSGQYQFQRRQWKPIQYNKVYEFENVSADALATGAIKYGDRAMCVSPMIDQVVGQYLDKNGHPVSYYRYGTMRPAKGFDDGNFTEDCSSFTSEVYLQMLSAMSSNFKGEPGYEDVERKMNRVLLGRNETIEGIPDGATCGTSAWGFMSSMMRAGYPGETEPAVGQMLFIDKGGISHVAVVTVPGPEIQRYARAVRGQEFKEGEFVVAEFNGKTGFEVTTLGEYKYRYRNRAVYSMDPLHEFERVPVQEAIRIVGETQNVQNPADSVQVKDGLGIVMPDGRTLGDGPATLLAPENVHLANQSYARSADGSHVGKKALHQRNNYAANSRFTG